MSETSQKTEEQNELPGISPGVDIWIVPTQTPSRFTQRIDWLLNFQIGKFERSTRVELSPELAEIAKSGEVEIPNVASDAQSPLMISSFELLPNKQTIAIPYASSEQWITDLKRIWSQLQSPKMRVFLPKALPLEKAESLWRPNSPTLEWIEETAHFESPT
jgi:hypothetical protein